MTSLICPGPGRVDLPTLGLVGSEGEPLEVPDDAVESLTAQGWTLPNPAAKATAKPKAEKAATEEGAK